MTADRRRPGAPAARAAAAVAIACLAGCQSLQPPQPDVFAEHEAFISRLNGLPGACLERLYLRCSQEAMHGRLGFGEVAACSVVYETVLQRRFGGRFEALLAWSRQHPDQAQSAGLGDDCSSDDGVIRP